ncbi:cbb3-type cytochrome oxidase assembly protein CcoS [Effusibacillus pohliae]|uniref:cbb3-type cytochrome oxidase assembly protein CcoS n=1 Tax=Effusibacillus pohliae TaxID=232270 RepID=UPI000378E150|nr:cbb3-type cytochrome oxidase assembly protein CcoS [Effusibacillus pohliae]
MTLQAWTLLIVLLTLTGSTFLVYVWANKAGQFDDIEEIKYRMLQDDEREGY